MRGGAPVGGARLRLALIALAVLAALAAAGAVLAGGDQQPARVAARALGDGAEAGEVAQAFLDAWAASDWDALQALTLDQSLDASTIHAEAARTLGITGARFAPEEPVTQGARTTVAFTATWALEGLDDYTYRGELTLRRDPQGSWRVAWWYPTLHPDLTPEARFERVRLFYPRAPILAADGAALVESQAVVVVGVQASPSDPAQIVDALARHTDADPDALAGLLAEERDDPDAFLPLVEVGEDDFSTVRDELLGVPGLVFHNETRRVPAHEGLAEALLGSTGPITAELLDSLESGYRQGDTVGRSGLERAYERQLAGTPALEARIVDSVGLVRSLGFADGERPQAVQTTIDPVVQEAAEAAVAELDAPSALVAVDAPTGAIRALVNSEGFDRALSGAYPPGSTFKVVTAAAALADGAQPSDLVGCPASVTVDGRPFRNADGRGAGRITLDDAFARSCNTTFVEVAEAVGAERMAAAAALFGFGTDYTVGLPSVGGTFPQPADEAEAAAAAIGQGRVQASPAHMASVAAAAASGTWRAPHLVHDGSPVPERPLPAGVADGLQTMMRSVVTRGTGTAANLPGVVGKTGSAQFGDASTTHAWFIGARDDLAFAVLVEGGGAGGGVAAPVAARFLRALP